MQYTASSPIFFTKMDEVPQESLRKHRQQLTPQIGTNGVEQFSSKKSYGALPAPDNELPSVAQKDKDKACSRQGFAQANG